MAPPIKAPSGGVVSTLRASPRRSLLGGILLLGALGFVYWREGQAVDRYRGLEESSGVVLTVGPDRVDPVNDGKLVYVRGTAQSTQDLVDDVFGVRAAAVRLVRHVEVYQWAEAKKEEKRKNERGEEEAVTTYVYTKRWSPTLIDARGFKEPESHKNPEKMPYDDLDLVGKDTRLGAFVLPEEAARKLTRFEPLKVTQDMLSKSPYASLLHEQQGAAFVGKNPQSPEVGDVMVTFQVVRPQTVSLVAQQSGGTFAPYKAGESQSVFLAEAGEVDAKSMFKTAKEGGGNLPWALRGLGALLAQIGLALLLVGFASTRTFLPRFERIPRVAAVLLAGALSLSLTSAAMGAAWVPVRPLVGVPLLVVAAACLGLALYAARRAKKT